VAEAERRYWDHRYRTHGRLATEPAAFVEAAVAQYAPLPGRAIDVAGGTGRHAVWLARRGWDVTLIDVSAAAVELARRDAEAAGVALTTRCEDLDEATLPAGPWDLVVVHHYLNRALFPRIARVLALGGLLVFAQPTVENLRRNDRPGPDHSLGAGEAVTLVSGLQVLSMFEGWTDDGRHEAQVVARRPA
jgi:SAM-dependent methyltransferase